MTCETWAKGMQWAGVYRAGPFGRKILGNCEKHFQTDAVARAPEKPFVKPSSLATALNEAIRRADKWAAQP